MERDLTEWAVCCESRVFLLIRYMSVSLLTLWCLPPPKGRKNAQQYNPHRSPVRNMITAYSTRYALVSRFSRRRQGGWRGGSGRMLRRLRLGRMP
jgi:hypothetical protein